METSGNYWKTFTLHTAVKLDVFSLIGENSLKAETLTVKLKGNSRAVTMFLNALVAMGLLLKENDHYKNTSESIKFLSKNSPSYVGYMIMHHHNLAESWLNMDQTLISGKPNRERSSHSTEAHRESFLLGMFNNAMSIAPSLSEKLNLSGVKRLLDLGGGPGTYAIHFCLANPGLMASVYDLPTTRPFAEKTIGRFGLSEKIDFIEGDFLEDEFTEIGQFDAVWLSHILHGERPENAENIIQKAVSVLSPGGKIFIHEFILENTLDGPLFPALFSLNMLLGTEGGQSYSEKSLSDMLVRQGAKDIKRLDFIGPTESGILSGMI